MNQQGLPTCVPNDKSSQPEDITEHERSPIEHAFYESFLLQSRSDIENLYASNIYWSQKHAKEVKDLNRQKMVVLTSMTKEQKEMVKRMEKLQEKQEQILDVKMKQYSDAKGKSGRRLRPHSTSAVPNQCRLRPEPPRPRSGSSTLLDPLGNQSSLIRSSYLSKSSQNLSQVSRLDVNQNNSKALSKSCEDLSMLDINGSRKPNKLVLPALQPNARSKSTEDLTEDDSTFITKIIQSPSRKPTAKQTLLAPAGFSPERRRGSLPNTVELERRIELERQRSLSEEPLTQVTQARYVPKTVGKSLPPL